MSSLFSFIIFYFLFSLFSSSLGKSNKQKIKRSFSCFLLFLFFCPSFPPLSSTRRNDLETYEKVTRATGPAMTWSMFAINYLEIGETEKADRHFRNGFQNYLQEPFLIWREVVDGQENNKNSQRGRKRSETTHESFTGAGAAETGAVNFLTGAGGFLQSLLFGYAGCLRVLSDRLEINGPAHLMSATANELIIEGIKYRGLSIDLIVRPRRGEEVKDVKGKEKKNKRAKLDQHGFSIRFRECKAATLAIMMIINDTEMDVECAEEKWCKYRWISGDRYQWKSWKRHNWDQSSPRER